MRSMSRVVSLVLIPLMMPAGVPVAAASPMPAAAPVAAQLSLPPVPSVNRTPPKVTPPPLRPSFSSSPTESEIARARVFEEPLAPAGPTTPRENRALGQALTRYLDAATPENLAPLERFLREHPGSAWSVAVLANLGLVSHRTGYVSKALAFHRQAWSLGKNASDPATRALADRSASELAWLLTGLGHDEELAALLREAEGRSLSGSSAQRMQSARQGLAFMQQTPEEAFRCGPVALNRVLIALGHPGDDRVGHALATPRGTSLAQVRALGHGVGVELHMGKREDRRAPMPVPAVVHFKTGHFAALVARSGGRYLVADPVFDEERWISAEAVDAEASGYVLAADLPEGFSSVGEAEAGTVWGRSCPSPPDLGQQGPCDETSGGGGGAGGGGCGSGKCGGMAGYAFLTFLAALRIQDTPIRYTPPVGPAFNFTLTYNQREVFQPAVFSYANVGPKWTFDAISYVEDDPSTSAVQTVRVYRRGGGMEVYALPAGTAPSAPNFRSRAVLARVSLSPIKYERREPDGSVETFGQPDGELGFPRKVFMTEAADPQGNKLSFLFNDALQIEAIVDALGQVSLLSYGDDASPNSITAMTDPFGRTARITYDSQGRIDSITDTLGLTSSFTYGDSDFITSMTTPYGTTAFSTGNTYFRTWLEAEDPMGGRERIEYVLHHDSSIGPRVLPPAEVPFGFSSFNGNWDAAATLFWDKRAMLLAPLQISSAEVTHWLEQPSTHKPRGIARGRKKALESRVWYVYEGQVSTHGDDGRLIKSGRLLDAGQTQKREYTHNTVGKPCLVTDPLSRKTRYTYGTNNVADAVCTTGASIDLLKVEQENVAAVGGWDVVEQFTFNATHQPLTMIDGAGQTTTYTYNLSGQLKTATTPPRVGIIEDRTTTYAYQPGRGGYLVSVVSPGNVTTNYTYDAYGRLRTMTNSDSDTMTYDYDEFDRPTRKTHPDGTYEEVAYDRLDAARHRDRLGRWTDTFRDPLRRVVAMRDAAGREVHQEWCICGSLSRLIDANGNATTWDYDIQGRVTREERANGSFKEFTYEASTSRLKERKDAKGQITHYTYADDDRLLQTSYSNEQFPTPDVTFEYINSSGQLDPYGRVRKMLDGAGKTGQTVYTYVPYGQLGAGKVQSVDGPYTDDTINYGYDELGRLKGRSFPGVTSTWNYDEQGRLTSQIDPIGTFNYTYQGNTRRLATLYYPNNQGRIYDYYDGLGDRLVSQVQHRAPNQTNLNKFNYSYDDVGDIKTWSQQADQTMPEEYQLEYDSVDQLVAATLVNGWDHVTVLKRYRYAYDPAGNRTGEEIDDVGTGASYDDMNRLLSQQPGGTLLFRGTTNEPTKVTVQGKPATTTPANQFSGNAQVGSGPTNVVVQASDYATPPNVRTNTYQVTQSGATKTFTYDANGNLTGDGTKTYEWDAEDRLIKVKVGGNPIAIFTYDGRGRRATKVGGLGVSYVWDGNEVLQERPDYGPRVRYVRGPGIDKHLAAVDENGTTTYFVSDHLGSVFRVTSSAGNPILTRKYDPWGNMLQGASTGGYAFTGREWDSETGLYYYRARYYDSKSGRFLSEDPRVTLPGIVPDEGLYTYVSNNPARFTDPTGYKRFIPPRDVKCPDLTYWYCEPDICLLNTDPEPPPGFPPTVTWGTTCKILQILGDCSLRPAEVPCKWLDPNTLPCDDPGFSIGKKPRPCGTPGKPCV